MSAIQYYKVIVNADMHGLRELQVYPPPETNVADYLRAGMQQRADVADDRPKGHVMMPSPIEHAEHGTGIRFLITHCIQPKTLKHLGQYLVDTLNSHPGNLTNLTHNLDLDEEVLATKPFLEDIPADPKYL